MTRPKYTLDDLAGSLYKYVQAVKHDAVVVMPFDGLLDADKDYYRGMASLARAMALEGWKRG